MKRSAAEVEPSGYVPVDLRDAADAGVDIFEDPDDVQLGERLLYGLPFRFGDREHAVVLTRPDRSTRVSLAGRPTWIIFAHALLEAELFEGGRIGDPVGSYRLEYADGSSVTRNLRQRFEIGPTPRRWSGRPLPLDWGQTPLLARNDAEHVLMDRACGRYDAAGAWLVGIDDPQSREPYVLPYRFYLWAMENPRTDLDLTGLTIEAGKASVMVGAVTLSHLDEEPFTRNVARDVVIDLHGRDIGEQLSVSVDRGMASHVYRTTPEPTDNEALPGGWGFSRPATWRTGYVRVAASPSATLSLREGAGVVGELRWGDLVDTGRLTFDWGVVRLPAPDQNWVRTTVRDESGSLLACRIRFQTLDGIPVSPYGHHAHLSSDGGTWNLDIGGDVRLGSYTYAAIDGTCEGWLPVGPVHVEVACGFEYEPIRRTVTVGPDQTDLQLTLSRTFDPLGRGYASGDTHIHFMSTHGAELEARAEGLHVANLLLSQWGYHFSNTEEFTGRPHVSHDHGTIVYAGQENRTNMLGHINLLGLREPIMPWSTGGSEEDELGGGLATTLSHWADECHAQGGTVVLAHFPVPYGETAALLATGRLDAVETIAYDEYNINEYYRYLNAGFMIPLVGGTDKMTSELPVGLVRTYAATQDSGVDYWAWCDGIKRGDTMVSSGPLLWMNVDGEPPGTVLTGSRDVSVGVELESIFPVDRVELIRNGEIIHCEPVPADASAHRFTWPVQVSGSDWLAARCFGAEHGGARHADVWQRPVFAHTSPVYVSSQTTYERSSADVLQNMVTMIDAARLHVTDQARTQWAGSVRHRHGEADHLAYLSRPFDEAVRAVRTRLDISGRDDREKDAPR